MKNETKFLSNIKYGVEVLKYSAKYKNEIYKFIFFRAIYLSTVYFTILGFTSFGALASIPYILFSTSFTILIGICLFAILGLREALQKVVITNKDDYAEYSNDKFWICRPLVDIVISIFSFKIFEFNNVEYIAGFAMFMIFVSVLQFVVLFKLRSIITNVN